jgi:hypothetical protein
MVMLEKRRPKVQTREKEGHGLGTYWTKAKTSKGRELKDNVVVKGLPCVEKI